MEGKIRAMRTIGGEYRYPESEIYRILWEQRHQDNARVSSAEERRGKGLKRLYELLKKRKIGKVLITYKDRLTRFRYKLLGVIGLRRASKRDIQNMLNEAQKTN